MSQTRAAKEALAAPARLLDEEELALVKVAAHYQRTVEAAALTHDPHRIAFYLYDLAAAFPALWDRGNDNPARRFLIEKIHNFLALGWNSRTASGRSSAAASA